MILKILLTGDVNLMNVTNPADPFAKVATEFKSADLVFSNLECCFYEPDAAHAFDREGFFAPLASAEALKIAGIDAVGIANNVNYGTTPILSSIARLDQLGIPHTGAGATLQKAREPAVLERQGLHIGMLQRTSVFWTTDHEAADNAVGVATIRGHTAYQMPMFRAGPGAIPLNRPGVAPAIVTWADPPSLQRFREDVAALKAKCDIVIASACLVSPPPLRRVFAIALACGPFGFAAAISNPESADAVIALFPVLQPAPCLPQRSSSRWPPRVLSSPLKACRRSESR
jgi:hypothetical protein